MYQSQVAISHLNNPVRKPPQLWVFHPHTLQILMTARVIFAARRIFKLRNDSFSNENGSPGILLAFPFFKMHQKKRLGSCSIPGSTSVKWSRFHAHFWTSMFAWNRIKETIIAEGKLRRFSINAPLSTSRMIWCIFTQYVAPNLRSLVPFRAFSCLFKG